VEQEKITSKAPIDDSVVFANKDPIAVAKYRQIGLNLIAQGKGTAII
jgi:hypothetical protein